MTGPADWPDVIHRVLGNLDVRQVGYVPDAGHSRLIELCQADPAMRAVVLTTEEEGIGARSPAPGSAASAGVLLMQSSGVGNCVNMLAAQPDLPPAAPDAGHHARRVGRVQSLATAHGPDRGRVLKLAGVIVERLDQAELAGGPLSRPPAGSRSRASCRSRC